MIMTSFGFLSCAIEQSILDNRDAREKVKSSANQYAASSIPSATLFGRFVKRLAGAVKLEQFAVLPGDLCLTSSRRKLLRLLSACHRLLKSPGFSIGCPQGPEETGLAIGSQPAGATSQLDGFGAISSASIRVGRKNPRQVIDHSHQRGTQPQRLAVFLNRRRILFSSLSDHAEPFVGV